MVAEEAGRLLGVAGGETGEQRGVGLRDLLDELGLAGRGPLRVTDLWHGGESRVDEGTLKDGLDVTVGPDDTPGGGIAVFAVTP